MTAEDIVACREAVDKAYEILVRAKALEYDAAEHAAYAMNDLLEMLTDVFLES
jgi:hypothetical protein